MSKHLVRFVQLFLCIKLSMPVLAPAASAEDATQRRRDRAVREHAGRDLVEQWLEERMILPIDQHDVRIDPPQLADARNPAESATDHDDVRTTFDVSPAELIRHATQSTGGVPKTDWRR